MRNSAFIIVLHRLRVPFLVLILSYTVAMIGLLVIDGIDLNGEKYQMSIFDAFYFVTYTATTIGFGETPFEFTYSQRIWVTFVVYLSVLGWFYSIGTIIGLIQDQQFQTELSRGMFKRQINGLKQKYIIVLGYNYTTSEIIKKAIKNQIRVVVIEQDENRVNNLKMESFTPIVPVLKADAFSPISLELAGINSIYCKAIVTLFEDDSLNLRVAITSKLLNKHILIASKSTTQSHSDNLKNLGVEIVKNPFEINASHIKMAIVAPNLLRVERWAQKLGKLSLPITEFPKGKYIVSGYGRLGHHIATMLSSLKIDATFIDIDNLSLTNIAQNKNIKLVIGDSDDREILLQSGIESASTIIIGTDNDTENLSILAAAKQLNKNIITVVRENDVEDFSIFKNAGIDYLFMPQKTLIHQISNAILNPLANRFNDIIHKQSEEWATKLVTNLITQINDDPLIVNLHINRDEAPQLYQAIDNKQIVKLSLLKTSLRDKKSTNNLIVLLVLKSDGSEILLPPLEYALEKDDQILCALDSNAQEDMEYIAQNMYEFQYAFNN